MQVDTLQMCAAIATGPALLLVRTLIRALAPVWLEAVRLRHRQRLAQVLPAGSTIDERPAGGGSLRIEIAHTSPASDAGPGRRARRRGAAAAEGGDRRGRRRPGPRRVPPAGN